MKRERERERERERKSKVNKVREKKNICTCHTHTHTHTHPCPPNIMKIFPQDIITIAVWMKANLATASCPFTMRIICFFTTLDNDDLCYPLTSSRTKAVRSNSNACSNSSAV